MDWAYTLNAIVLPPGCFLITLAIGLGFRYHEASRRAANILFFISLFGLYSSSTPLVARSLMTHLQDYPAMSPSELLRTRAKAIVVLGGGTKRNAPEYLGDSVHIRTLQRIRYAAFAQSLTDLPILTSGGVGPSGGTPEADVMASTLTKEFHANVRWRERVSRTTFENAYNTSAILKENDIDHILLVTHAWHMPRAKEAFESMGIQVSPAPTDFANTGFSITNYKAWLPNAESMQNTAYAIHEFVGRWWYSQFYKQP